MNTNLFTSIIFILFSIPKAISQQNGEQCLRDIHGSFDGDNLFSRNPNADGECMEIASDVTDAELKNLSEELFNKESQNEYKYVTVNLQGHTTSKSLNDEAPEPLLTVQSQALETPTIKRLLKLFDNYELDSRVEEYVSPEEHAEENALIDEVLSTDVMAHAMRFLSDKGFFKRDYVEYKDRLKRIWFGQYSRGKGIVGSSGFEHVFLAENKLGKKIIGFHNWIYFNAEEVAERLEYLGYIRTILLGDKAMIAQLKFIYNGKKKSSSIFIGTSPELEMALYTICFFTRPDRYCRVSLAGTKVGIQTYKWEGNGMGLLAAAFPMT